VIADKLDEWYAQKGARDQEARAFKFGPSNLGDCQRKLAHLLSGVEPAPLSPETVRTFELGHQRGEALEEACKAIWPDARTQVAVRIPCGKFTIEGTCDLWIPSLRTVVDFKTQAVFGFGLLDEEGVSLDYKLQVHAYRMGMVSAEGWPPSAVRCVLVYEAKDSDARKGIKGQQLKELEVPYTDELQAEYEERMMALERMLLLNEMGQLDPKAWPELPLDSKGKKSWKCRMDEKTGRSLYCPVGQIRGGCYGR